MYWLKLLVVFFACVWCVVVVLASILGPLVLAVWYGSAWWLVTYAGSLVLIALVYLAAESMEVWLHE